MVNNAKAFLGDEPFMFYLGDNIILGSLKNLLRASLKAGTIVFWLSAKLKTLSALACRLLTRRGI